MYKSKLIELFRSLNRYELRRLDVFVQAHRDVLQENVWWLYCLVRDHFADPNSPKLDRQYVIGQLFADRADAKRAEDDWRRLMSHLTRLIENFLIQTEFASEELMPKVFLLRAYANRGLNTMFDEEFAKLTRPAHHHTQYEVHHLLYTFLIEEEKYNREALTQNSALYRNVDTLLFRLDMHYLVTRLRIVCDLYNRHNFLQTKLEKPWLLDEMLAFISNNATLSAHPLVAIYHRALLMQMQPDSREHYQAFIDYLQNHEHNFTPTLLYDLYFYAKNYCFKQINKGDSSYYEMVFLIYQKFFDENNSFKVKHIIKEEFKNVITICMRLNEIAYVERFIELYSRYLHADDRNLALDMAQAELSFYKQDYSKALDHLYHLRTSDPYATLNAKTLMLKCYYELHEAQLLDAGINAAISYLSSQKKIPDEGKWNYRIFFRYLRKLNNVREAFFKEKARKDIVALKNQMESENLTVFVWIYKKVCELNEQLQPISS